MRITSSSLLTAAALFTLQGTTQASLLVYEGFNYGGTAKPINGTVSTATGLGSGTNVWSVTNTVPAGGAASANYQTVGLTFSSNFAPTTGGALAMHTEFDGGADATSIAALQLSTSTTGTLWSSYLVSASAIGNANSGSLLQGVATTTTGNSYFRAGQVTNIVPADRKWANGYDNGVTVSGNAGIATNTTYLLISRFTNVGLTLGASPNNGAGTTWVFTSTQYDLWYANGSQESQLNTYANFRVSDASVTSGTFTFDSNGYIQFRTNAPDVNGFVMTGVYDELRYGTTLADVTAIPEPSGATVFAMGLVGLFFANRSRRTVVRL